MTKDSSDEDIRKVILAVVKNYPSNENVAASLARVLTSSGNVIYPQTQFTADVASTGGPSSLSTLLCPLFLRCAGALVPKLGLPGRPAGGIDCLAQIPTYNVALSGEEVRAVLCAGGYAHFISHQELIPLDARMFHLRQAVGAQAIPTLVIASLLAKKKAVGVNLAGIDVRVAPHGNFGKTWNQAKENSQLLCRTAHLLGITASTVLTEARYPYQPYIGRKESLLALEEIFSDTAGEWLSDHLETCRLISMSCMPAESHAAMAVARSADLHKIFERNLIDQGATLADFTAIVQATRNQHRVVLTANRDGFCAYALKKLRDAIVTCQKMLVSSAIPYPDPVGLVLLKRPGTWVKKGEAMATLRADSAVANDRINTLCRLVCTPSTKSECPGMETIYE
jgi:pyrimidine-nucleoside phosphorylase